MAQLVRAFARSGAGSFLVAVAFAVSLVCSCLVSFAGAAYALEAEDSTGLEKLTLETRADDGTRATHDLSVEVMRTEAGREKGLMNRRFLPRDRGMLFDFGTEQTVLMWMKNTYIPLDMVFLSHSGVVTHIAEGAEPLSEAIISSEKPAYGVLEVNAGYVRKIGLKVGDVVHHPMFKP